MLSSLWKTLERVLLSRLTAIVRPRIVDEQGWGFPGRGVQEQLFSLSEAVSQSTVPVFACFLDIKEAFDSLWLEQMLIKLAHQGVDRHAWTLITNWYLGYQARVRTRLGGLTAPFPVQVGTRQGSVLSPLMFAVFINDLALRLKAARSSGGAPLGIPLTASGEYLQCLLYGDDIVLLGSSEQDLQSLISIAGSFASEHKLRFAIGVSPSAKETKCKVMQLGPSHAAAPPGELLLQGKRLPWVATYKYLGVEFAAGPDPFHAGVLLRCNLALAACREWASVSFTRSTRPPPEENRSFYLAIVCASRDFGLHAVDLSPSSWRALQANEATCTSLLRCPLQKGDRLPCRFRDRRRTLELSLGRAPAWSWRRGLLLARDRPPAYSDEPLT